ncbi:hypothetical protein AMTR_s00148p00050790 [Amborella trichopoda]|uniref:Uncharacterized protein n=1 Tax=Amborella trichopoda TaxID=13333 RepID=W1PL11_AMBTC|nr:hypothetical protein AMTR_s00148p00050790 [Amborella trichopoda]
MPSSERPRWWQRFSGCCRNPPAIAEIRPLVAVISIFTTNISASAAHVTHRVLPSVGCQLAKVVRLRYGPRALCGVRVSDDKGGRWQRAVGPQNVRT